MNSAIELRSKAHEHISRTRLAIAKAWNRGLVRTLALVFGQRPVPLNVVRAVRTVTRGTDPLVPPTRPETGFSGEDSALARLLAGRELGVWTLGSASLRLLRGTIEERRPRSVLEFGSGVSTLALASVMTSVHGALRGPCIVSIEQDAEQAALTRRGLVEAGLEALVDLRVAPLTRRSMGGRMLSTYDIDPKTILHRGPFDLVLIDGPLAEPGARYTTLALFASSISPGATILLDDALRDGEIWAASGWERLPGIKVDGVLVVDKGVLRVTVGHPSGADER